MTDRERLIGDLRRTLRDKAASVVVDDRAFAPSSPTMTAEAPVDRPNRVRGRVLVAAILVVVVGGAAIAVRVASTSRHAVRVISPPTTVAGVAPGRIVEVDSPVVAPSWVPAGQQLWSFQTTRTTVGAGVTQLLGLPQRGSALQSAIFLDFQPFTPPPPPPPGVTAPTFPGEPAQVHITVRGVQATVEPSKDSPGTAGTITWSERRASVAAIVRGLSYAQAQQILGRLRPAGPDLAQSGFTAASVPKPYTMLGQQLAQPEADDTTAIYGYWAHEPAPNSQPDLFVTTGRHYIYPGYLRTAIGGGFDRDGAAIQYDPDFHNVIRATRDGNQVMVVERPGLGLPPSTLERIARSVGVIGAQRAADLRRQVDVRLQSLPLIGTARVPLGTVTLRGRGAAVTVCLDPSHARISCSSVPAGAGFVGSSDYSRLAGGVVTHAGWIVFSASSHKTVWGNMTSEHATIGPRDVLVALIPPPNPEVQLWVAQNPPGATGPGIVGAVQRPRDG